MLWQRLGQTIKHSEIELISSVVPHLSTIATSFPMMAHLDQEYPGDLCCSCCHSCLLNRLEGGPLLYCHKRSVVCCVLQEVKKLSPLNVALIHKSTVLN